MDPLFDLIKGKLKCEADEHEHRYGFSINSDLLPRVLQEGETLVEAETEIEEMKALALKMRLFEVKKSKRLNIFAHVLLTFTCQFILVGLTFYELGSNVNWWPNFF